MREILLDAYRAALEAVDPEEKVFEKVEDLDIAGDVTIAALGKAAPGMVRGAARSLGARLIGGVAVSDHAEPVPESIRLVLGSHPVPDATSVTAGKALLETAASARDHLLVLVSGGGSALAEVPIIDVTEVGRVQTSLTRAGAKIHELNIVRRHLSRLKNGGLLRATRVPVTTLLISDVVDGPAGDIASGPTIRDDSTLEDARAIIERYGLRELPLVSFGDANVPPDHRFEVIADYADAVRGAADHLRSLGYAVETSTIRGEAVQEVHRLCDRLSDDSILVAGGETTVIVTGDGTGGRNQHAALAAASVIEGVPAFFAALGTDGGDGPTDAAGAIVDGGTAGRIRAAGLDPIEMLSRCDSHTALAASSDLVKTGSTGTNVGDIWMVGMATLRS